MRKTIQRLLSLALCLLLCAALLPGTVWAAEIVDSGTCGENLTWTLDSEGKLTISGTGEMEDYLYRDYLYYISSPWYGKRSSVKTVEIRSGVTSIGNYAFCLCDSLTSVTIPNSVTSIGGYAFHSTPWLQSLGDYAIVNHILLRYQGDETDVTIPNSVTSIAGGAFASRISLTRVSIPNSVTSIGEWAFNNCSSLTSVTIGNGVTSIGEWAFYNCSSLTTLAVNTDNSVYCDISGVLFSKNHTVLCIYPTGKTGSYSIPDSVTSIGDRAFYGCRSLTSVMIPNSVTSIGSYAFYNCYSLTSVTIPNSVTSIGDSAFSSCSSLTSVTIPNSVTSIGDSAFSSCSSLTSVTIPDSVTSIGYEAFEYCRSLTSVTIPNSVTSIGYGAFSSCSSLTSVTIPNSVTSIGNWAFSNCRSLTSVTIPNSVTSIGDSAFYYCSSLTSVTIPNSVTSIGGSAFSRCTSLTSVTIPNSVTSIGSEAFYGCSSLTSVTIPNSVTSIGSGVFWDCDSLTSVTIPDSVTSIGGGAFSWCDSLTDIYYTGTEAQWDAISGSGKPSGSSVTIHFLSTGPDTKPATVPSGQYCIHVIDEAGAPVQDARVVFGATVQQTDRDGNALFSDYDGTPQIQVNKDGYIPWDNAHSNWEPDASRYEIVPLFPDTFGNCKLKEASFSLHADRSHSTDLLTKTKTMNLKNDGNLIGDLDSGTFYLCCTAAGADPAAAYELWQRETKIAVSTDGNFGKLSVADFSKGGGCFVRVTDWSGIFVDTRINLEFADNTVNKENNFTWKGKALSLKLRDDIPFVGGSTIQFELPIETPLVIVDSESKIGIGFNLKLEEGKSVEEQVKKYCETLEKAYHYANTQLADSKSNMAVLKRLVQKTNEAEFFKSCQFSFAGYVEVPKGSQLAEGYLALTMQLKVFNMEYNTVVVVVPVTVQVGLDFSLEAADKAKYDLVEKRFTEINFALSPKFSLNAFGGIGVSKLVGVGAYGNAELSARLNLFGTDDGWKNVDLTGELGLKAYFAWLTYQRAFAHQTWHLYTANTVDAAEPQTGLSGWTEGVYDVGNYEKADLSYLADESDWLSGDAALMEAGAGVALTPLLTGTYRNARPVMVSDGTALYAAFVRAEQDGKRYVAVTRYDGSAWSQPVRVDDAAILDDAPCLCASERGVYLAYARTATEPGDSLLAWAKAQELVVGRLDPVTLRFTEERHYAGAGRFAHLQELALVDGQPMLVWAEAAVSDDNSVLRPDAETVCYALRTDGGWGDAQTLAELSGAVDALTPGLWKGDRAAVCSVGGALELVTGNGETVTLCENGAGRARYGLLPGAEAADFYWSEDGGLTSAGGCTVPAAGIGQEFAVVGDTVYFSLADEGCANLAALRLQDGTWSLPILLTGEERYLENLNAARLNGRDYILGMHTLVSIAEDSLTDEKNLVWSPVLPVSDLRLEDIRYEDAGLSAGDAVTLTLTVSNAGSHTVNRMDLLLDGETKQSFACSLAPGEETELLYTLSCPETLTDYPFTVIETGEEDYHPEDNSAVAQVGYADVETVLDYLQVGTSRSLIATITNRGVAPADGVVSFYDAAGELAGMSGFSALAPGDTLIVTHKLTPDFDGFYGGDVAVRVRLDQDELHQYNNDDSLYIPEPDASVRSLKLNGTQIEAEISVLQDGVVAYCAEYNSAGQMLSITSQPVPSGVRAQLRFARQNAESVLARVFLLDESCAPLFFSRELVL